MGQFGGREGWTDGRTNGWTLFFWTLPAKAGGPKIEDLPENFMKRRIDEFGLT